MSGYRRSESRHSMSGHLATVSHSAQAKLSMSERPPARERLESYRALVTSAAPLADVMVDSTGMHMEVYEPDELEVICSLPPSCPADNRELLLRHIDIPADLIGMLDAAARRDAERQREIERLRQSLEAKGCKPAKDYAAECSMRCAEPDFMRFLKETHDLPNPVSDTTAATRVRSVLAISSRSELNIDPAAAARWRRMVREFETWRRRV